MLLALRVVLVSLIVGVIVVAAQGKASAQQTDGHAPETLPGTAPLKWDGDIASRMIEGADRFLLREIARSVQRRASFWSRDCSTVEAYETSIAKNRDRLAHILGVRDVRTSFAGLELLSTTSQESLVAEGECYRVYAVRWPVIHNMNGEGLLLVPNRAQPIANVIAIPDADQTPEMISGLVGSIPEESQYARRLAQSGCRVLVPTLIDRRLLPRNGRAVLSNREFIYRSAFELGRHIIGYEVQKVLAGVDWFVRESGDDDPHVAVVGWGEGAMLALYSAALDTRIDVSCVSGYFEERETVWQQPIDRNVFGLLEQFGDAELAAMVAPRHLIIEAAQGPQVTFVSGKGSAPGRLATPNLDAARREYRRAQEFVQGLSEPSTIQLAVSEEGQGPYLTSDTLQDVLESLAVDATIVGPLSPIRGVGEPRDTARRAERQLREMDDLNQWLLQDCWKTRAKFMQRLDTSSVAAYRTSTESYRTLFRDEVIGSFDQPLLAPNVRSRKAYDKPAWTGYEVVLDVFPDVIAYGILLIPKGIQADEKRPVVVCQHGLEGRPQDVVAGSPQALRPYHDFAAKLAEQGFITFAPQNPYIFGDRFRTLQRKANPLKKTLFSVIVPQHQQIVDWLQSLPNVDPDRIGFYGLSYGGKSAMRIPALVKDYCLSICSGDFNEWVWKNASTREAKYSYVWTGEYEIFEFDLGSTFNYAEMAALIAPRPFMVERGHFDGVASDEMVAFEFAKVRHLYAAKLKLPNRCEIEWFDGPHCIHGKGTYDFLHRHLDW